MKNVFFPDEDITENDLYFVCYMIEKVSRQIKQHNRYTVNKMGYDELSKKLSSANVLHCQNPLQTASDWIDEFALEKGAFDVSAVNPYYCEKIPTETQMGKVYKRLILNTMPLNEDYAQAIIRVYNTIYVLKMDIICSRGLPPMAIIKHRNVVVIARYNRISGVRI